MKGLPFVLLFTAMTFVSWGAYGPVLHHGAVALKHDAMRAFVGVGLAYFMIAVLIPFMLLKKNGEVGRWTLSGAIFSLIAGAVGALGALGVILALGYGGATVYVMPLVFGFAPIVNTLVTAFLSRTFHQIRPIFIVGVVAAALGAGGVLAFKPTPPKAVPVAAAAVEGSAATDVVDETASTSDSPADSAAHDTSTPAAAATASPAKKTFVPGVFLSILMAAVCWGSYGPMLHIGQGKMSGSRLRPFACVGLSYFFIAVAAPLALIYSRVDDAGAWTAGGMTWSFLAGIAGALGALGVILAFNAGGRPYYVMPLVFGFAPVINTFISLSEAGTWSLVEPRFWISLAIVIAGAVTVLTNAPKPPPKPSTAPAAR
ncbi:MAG: hypothetical protein KDA45_15035 [Planctomycetales bacterium]|nr:hypothetical protein [Planctomycetales bacterium]